MNTRHKGLFIGIILPAFFIMTNPAYPGQGHASKNTHASKAHKQEKKTHHKSGGHKMHLFTADWHDTLDAHQKKEVDAMHLQLMKESAPIKGMIRVKKIELAILATEEKANSKAIHQKIDEILELKRQKMQKRLAHIVEMRQMLSPEQQLSYDMRIVSRAKKGRK